jgi:8-oxo-dGTP pyrophosphatase MutT (NUDIX family)
MPTAKRSRAAATAHNISTDILIMNLPQLRDAYPDYRIRCGILLMRENDGRILVVKERPRGSFTGHIYGPPKGSVQPGDANYFDAARRELFEETGITLPEPSSGAGSSSTSAATEVPRTEFITFHHFFREILFLFPVIIKNPPDLHPEPGEIEECQWLTLDELRDRARPKSSCTRTLIADLCAFVAS